MSGHAHYLSLEGSRTIHYQPERERERGGGGGGERRGRGEREREREREREYNKSTLPVFIGKCNRLLECNFVS